MSENTGLKIFFLKAYPRDLLAVESYLVKRNYDVASEADIKQAIFKIIQFNPAVLFIAWDHPHEQIQTICKFITQSVVTTVVPYIESPRKEQIRLLDSSGFIHRVYPPLSGPAIIRAILKIEKDLAPAKKVGKKISTYSDGINDGVAYRPDEKAIAENLQDFLNREEKSKQSKTLNMPGLASGQRSDLLLDQPAGAKRTDMLLDQSAGAKRTDMLLDQPEGVKRTDMLLDQSERGQFLKTNQSRLKSLKLKKMDDSLKNALKEEFQNIIKDRIVEMSQTYRESEGNQESLNNFFPKLVCLVIQSDSWCGYLLVASDVSMEPQHYQAILQTWLQNQLVNMDEITENDYFYIHLENSEKNDLRAWAEEKADYLERLEIEDHEVLVSFFSIDPKHLIIEISDSNEMLEVPLELVRAEKKLGLSLFLHLPDNKKYILYTPAEQMLSIQQKNKLSEKSIHKLFTPLNFAKELNIMKAETFLNSSLKANKLKST